MRGRWVEDRIEERICKIRVIDGVIANYYPQEEMIRCKDCKHYRRNDRRTFIRGSDCSKEIIDTIVPDKDFCSRAERKEE